MYNGNIDPDNTIFEEFFAARLKHKGMTIKKLGEATGISLSHLQEIARADFSALPSAPYVHGYFVRIGKALDFDGEEWWGRIKDEGLVRNSGSADALPKNRFARESPMKLIGLGIVVLLIFAYLIIQFPRLWGTPTIVVLSPDSNPATTDASTMTIQGTVKNADSLYLNGDEITIAQSGSWQKDVLLAPGENSFTIVAKKFLRGETDIVEQIMYESTSTDSGAGIPATTTMTVAPTSTTPTTSTEMP